MEPTPQSTTWLQLDALKQNEDHTYSATFRSVNFTTIEIEVDTEERLVRVRDLTESPFSEVIKVDLYTTGLSYCSLLAKRSDLIRMTPPDKDTLFLQLDTVRQSPSLGFVCLYKHSDAQFRIRRIFLDPILLLARGQLITRDDKMGLISIPTLDMQTGKNSSIEVWAKLSDLRTAEEAIRMGQLRMQQTAAPEPTNEWHTIAIQAMKAIIPKHARPAQVTKLQPDEWLEALVDYHVAVAKEASNTEWRDAAAELLRTTFEVDNRPAFDEMKPTDWLKWFQNHFQTLKESTERTLRSAHSSVTTTMASLELVRNALNALNDQFCNAEGNRTGAVPRPEETW